MKYYIYTKDWILPPFFQNYAMDAKWMNNSGLLKMMDLTFINIVRWRAGGVQMRTGWKLGAGGREQEKKRIPQKHTYQNYNSVYPETM